MAETDERPEYRMVRKAIVPGVLAVACAGVVGAVVGGVSVAWSAAIGVALAVANFGAAGLLLAWAAGISLVAVQVVALGGFVTRLGAILGLMFALKALPWFSPLAFGLAIVPATVCLLLFESSLLLRGLGQQLVIKPAVQPTETG